MAFCSFDDSAALFDSTPVENMFITEYMLRAPGDYVKVYLYGLMLCYHNAERMSPEAMAKDLDLPVDEVEKAFKYWIRNGLIRQTGDRPVTYSYYNLKQLTLLHAQNPGDTLYRSDFTDEVQRMLGDRLVTPAEFAKVQDWVDVFELPEEVVLMLLQTELKRCKGRGFSFTVADRVAQEWAQRGVRTVEDVEQMVILGKERENQLKKLLARLGQRRFPSEDEKRMYGKWIDEWGFTPEAVQEACRETTKGTPTMAYLDGILLRQHQLGRHDVQKLAAGMKGEHTARDFARNVLAGLGRTGVTPTAQDLEIIEAWREDGYTEELILTAVDAAHRRAGGGSMDDVDAWLKKWRTQGLTTREAVVADSKRNRALNAQLREIYDAAGLDTKKPNAADRDLLCRWAGEMNMPQELILLAAHYARGGGAPMLLTGRILSDWEKAGIRTEAEAQAEHEKHVSGHAAQTAGGAQQTQTGRTQDMMMRHRYTSDDYRSMVVDLDEEES